jgi:hypothetical protein
MGDEADADWQEGLVEWGREDVDRQMKDLRFQTRHGVPFKKQKKRRPAKSADTPQHLHDNQNSRGNA